VERGAVKQNCLAQLQLSEAPSKFGQRNLKKQLYFSLQLGLPSTLIRQENEAFQKRRNLKTPDLPFCVDGKHFNEGFQKH